MLFGARRAWIEPDQLPRIFEDDEYRRVGEGEQPWPGDVVVYRKEPEGEITHVGLVLHVEPDITKAGWNITVLSKWGQHGEHVHSINDIPFWLGVAAEFWTERRVIQ